MKCKLPFPIRFHGSFSVPRLSRARKHPIGMIRGIRATSCLLYYLVLVTLAGLATSGRGQDNVLRLSEKELRASATYKVDPEYPAVARQIRLTGDVELEISVDAVGAVETVKVLRGNTLLSGSSVQAAKRWKFKPFGQDGQGTRAVGPLVFNFQM